MHGKYQNELALGVYYGVICTGYKRPIVLRAEPRQMANQARQPRDEVCTSTLLLSGTLFLKLSATCTKCTNAKYPIDNLQKREMWRCRPGRIGLSLLNYLP